MIRWNNDYNHTAHPAVLQALAECSEEGFDGYGQDRWCRQAADRIRQLLGPDGRDADVQFLSGGTQSNLTVITAASVRWRASSVQKAATSMLTKPAPSKPQVIRCWHYRQRTEKSIPPFWPVNWHGFMTIPPRSI